MDALWTDERSTAGLALVVGAAQFMTLMMLGEAIAPGYSMHDDAISDLGTIDETRALFNSSLFAIGLLNVVGGYFLFRVHRDRILFLVFTIGGIGAMGAGLIPLDSTVGIHGLFALLAFLFINLEAILCAREVRSPLRLFSVAAGTVGLSFLVVMMLVDAEVVDPSNSIGHGGVERMIAYPALLWMLVYGGHLIDRPDASP